MKNVRISPQSRNATMNSRKASSANFEPAPTRLVRASSRNKSKHYAMASVQLVPGTRRIATDLQTTQSFRNRKVATRKSH